MWCMKIMQYNPAYHHRRSIRLKGYDYTQNGAYFVTICAYQREAIFGEVVGGEMQLAPIGQIIQTEWFRSAAIRKEIRLFEDEFVVMPNHVHGIVWIVEPQIVGANGVRPNGVHPFDGICQKGVRPVNVRPDGVRPIDGEEGMSNEKGTRRDGGTRHDGGTRRDGGTRHDGGTRRVPLQRRMAPRSLGAFIAGFKAAVTSRAGRELQAAIIWQRNYYEHIIRNENELENIWNYIDTNPLRWQEDQLQPAALPNPFNQKTP